MMWAILGDIEFEVIGSPSGWEQRFSATFAEHERISGKPLVEAVGGQLDEISWDIRLHERLHDVAARLRAIRTATVAQEPLALVMGDGAYLGPWIIVEGAVTARKTTAQGRLISADVQVTLREYTGEFAGPSPSLLARLGLWANPVQPGLLTQSVQTPTVAQALAQAARTAENALVSVNQTIQTALGFSPAAAIMQVPGVLNVLGQAQRAATLMRDAPATVQAGIQGVVAIASVGSDVVAAAHAARALLIPPTPATIADQMSHAAAQVDHALQRVEQTRAPLLALTASVALRRS